MAQFPANRNTGDETSREAWLLVSSQGVNADTQTQTAEGQELRTLGSLLFCIPGPLTDRAVCCFILIPGRLPI